MQNLFFNYLLLVFGSVVQHRVFVFDILYQNDSVITKHFGAMFYRATINGQLGYQDCVNILVWL